MVPQVQGINSLLTMGIPPVPLRFPISLAPPLSPTPPAARESCSTSSYTSHTIPPSSSTSVSPMSLPFGDPIPSPKPNSSFRVGFCNIGGFSSNAQVNHKGTDVKHFITVHHLDLFGGCESNINWRNLPEKSQLKEWFRVADSCCTFSAHNLHESLVPCSSLSL